MTSQLQNAIIQAEGVIKRLQKAFDVPSDAQLARKLHVSPGTISSWRSRGTIPYEAAAEIAEKEGFSLDWLLLGRGPKMAGGSVSMSIGPEPKVPEPADIPAPPQAASHGVDVDLLVKVMEAIEKNATFSMLPNEEKNRWTGKIYNLCKSLNAHPDAILRKDAEG